MDDYFELTDKGLIIRDDTIMLVPCFNEVYKRDISSIKEQAFKELHYIFQMSDIRSSSLKKGLKGKELIKDAIKSVKLPADYKADNTVANCIKYYRDDRSNIVVTSYMNLLTAFGTANQTIEFLDDVLRAKISSIKDSAKDDETSMLDSDTIKLITSSIRELLTLGTEVPKKIQELKGIKERALSDNKSGGVGRGDVLITDSMNPANSVSNR